MIDEVKFFAWLDGELPQGEAAEIAEKVARSPELTAKAERHRALARQLRGAFDSLLADPVELPSAEVVSLRRAPALPFGSTGWGRQVAALAASLAFGILVGREVTAPSAPIADEGGKLVAAASLDEALTRQLASVPTEEDVRIALTFRDRHGRICRTFSGKIGSGLACNVEGQWAIVALTGAVEGQAFPYRMAAGPSPEVADLAARLMEGDPFDARQEREALRRGWR